MVLMFCLVKYILNFQYFEVPFNDKGELCRKTVVSQTNLD